METGCFTRGSQKMWKRAQNSIVKTRGTAYIRTHLPVQLVCQESKLTRSQALICEAQVKKLSRPTKEKLVAATEELAKCVKVILSVGEYCRNRRKYYHATSRHYEILSNCCISKAFHRNAVFKTKALRCMSSFDNPFAWASKCSCAWSRVMAGACVFLGSELSHWLQLNQPSK